MAKTASDLLTNIKRRSQLPDDGGTLSDADILAFASDELSNVVAPRLMAVHEWHYAFFYTQTVTSLRNYRLSYRTAGNSILSVEYYDGTTYRTIQQRHPLTQTAGTNGASVENFSIFGNNIVLSDGCPTSGTLRIKALLRPSALVTTGCFNVTAANSNTKQITISATATFASNQSVDVIFNNSPYEMLGLASVASVDSGTLMTLTAADMTGVDLSTYAASGFIEVCPAETSDRIMLPDEFHDYLAQRVAIRCMEARGFKQDMDNHLAKLKDLETAFGRLASPRARGEFKAILPVDYFFAGRP